MTGSVEWWVESGEGGVECWAKIFKLKTAAPKFSTSRNSDTKSTLRYKLLDVELV